MRLIDVLERGRALGFLGPGPVERHVEHAAAFAAALGDEPGEPIVDLGSGGGVPGLVLAERWPAARFWLVDARGTRTAFLTEAVQALRWPDRIAVHTGRAEDLGRHPDLRHGAGAVVARSFGPPGVTAECAAPFLRVGGVLVVSEPPGGDADRWPPAGLAELGLVDDGSVKVDDATVRRLVAERLCGDRFPRANGVPAKKPLF